jgi:hypothetical protein
VQPKACAGDRVGELLCVLGRNGGVGVAVVHKCRDPDRVEIEALAACEEPQILRDPSATVTERFHVTLVNA